MSSLDQYNDLYKYDLPEQFIVLDGIRGSATRLGLTGVLAAANQAIPAVEHALALESQWRTDKASVDRQKAREINHESDGRLAQLHKTLDLVSTSAGHPHQAAARKALLAAFPGALADHVRANWDEGTARTKVLIDNLRTAEHAPVIEALWQKDNLDRIASLYNDFLTISHPVDAVTSDEVAAATQMAWEMTKWVIHTACASASPQDPAAVDHRERVMADVRAVQARLKARYAHRPTPKKADCDTPATPPAGSPAAPAGSPPAPAPADPSAGAPATDMPATDDPAKAAK